MNHHEREEGELEKEETQKSEKIGEETSEYTKRAPTSQWSCRNADLYEKVHQVGEGTFGKVYKAKIKPMPGKSHTSEHVALKRILMENEKEGFPITAIREIMILKRLSHQNIINLHEVVTSKPSEKNKFRGNVYLVFEYMEHDLSGLVDLKINFTISQIKCMLYQILTGISYLHTNNVIHRDIKGANILINNRGEVKIADFGLARIHNPNPNINKIYTNRVVTLWYRAPELLLGSTNYGPSIDMWSVGCLFSELLAGVPPFRSNKENEQLEKIFEKCGTPTEDTWPGLTTLRHYSSAPKVMYPNILKTYYADNKLVDEVAFNLLSKLLELNPNKRITAKEALEHQFFKDDHLPKMCNPEDLPKIDVDSHEFQSRQNKQKQQAGKQAVPNQMVNAPFKPKDKGEMIVGKQGYNNNHNPNYYNKVTTKQVESKLKIEESQLITGQGNVVSSSFSHSSRLEALCSSNNQPNENLLLNNKRYNETSIDEGDPNALKKQKQSPSDHM